jgi:hypothetical protein
VSEEAKDEVHHGAMRERRVSSGKGAGEEANEPKESEGGKASDRPEDRNLVIVRCERSGDRGRERQRSSGRDGSAIGSEKKEEGQLVFRPGRRVEGDVLFVFVRLSAKLAQTELVKKITSAES